MSEKQRIAEQSVLVGMTDAGLPLPEEQCRALLTLPAASYTAEGQTLPQWLKREGRHDPLDDLVPMQKLIADQAEKLSPALTEEAERLRLAARQKKAALSKEIAALETRLASLEREREAVTGDRLKRLTLDKQLNRLRREVLQRQENQFFDVLRVEAELEEQLEALAVQENLTARVIREFIVRAK